MTTRSPVDILFTTDSVEVAQKDGVAVPTNARGFIGLYFDGANLRFARSDASGRGIFVGAGTAGTPAGGVLSVQGDPSGTPVPVSGTVAITSAQLPPALLLGKLDTNVGSWLGSTTPTVGQKVMAGSIPVTIASDQAAIPITGSITASNPSIGLSGSTAPTSATLIGGQSGANLEPASAYDLDTGVGSEFVLGASLRLPASGGSVAGGTSTNPIRTDPTGTTPQPVSGTLTANQGNAGTHAQRWMVGLSDGSGFINPATDRTTAAAPFAQRLSDGAAFYDAAKTGQLPTALVSGRLDTNVGSWLGATTPTVGQKAMAASLPVAFASDQSALSVSQGTPAAAAGAWFVKVTDGTSVLGTSGSPIRIDPTGTTPQPVKLEAQLDYDTSGGTQNISIVGIALPTGGGAVAGGTSTNPIRTDPTGTTPQPVSGTVTANQGTANTAANGWFVKVTDGVNTLGTSGNPLRVDTTNTTVQSVKSEVQIDYDTGAGTQSLSVHGIALPASGGAVAGGTSTNPIRTDPTGTTTQPVSGTVISNQGTPNSLANNWPVSVTDGTNVLGTSSNPLRINPTGTTTQPVQLEVQSDFNTGAGTQNISLVGLALPANGGAVVGGTATNPLRIDTVGTTVQPINGIVTANQGTPNTSVNSWWVRLTDGTGVPILGTSATPIRTDPTGTTTQPISGTVTANIGTSGSLALDATLTGGTARTKITDGTNNAAVINTTAAGTEYGVCVRIVGASGGTSSSFGSVVPATGTAAGFSDGTNMQLARVFDADSGAGTQYVLGVNLRKSASGGSSELVGQATMANSIPVVIASDQSVLAVGGDVASGSSDSGNPVKIGGVGRTTNPTAVSDGQRVNGFFDKVGRIVNVPHAPRARVVTQVTTISNTTAETTVLAAGGSGVFRDIVGIVFSNTSGAAIRVDFRDSSGGTIRWAIFTTASYGATDVYNMPVPFPQATANNVWTAQCNFSAADIRITMIAVENN